MSYMKNEFEKGRENWALKHTFYELYLINWINDLSNEEISKASLKFFNALKDFEHKRPENTFYEYMIQNGCEGKYPLTFSEFLHENLLDYSYIHKLTNGNFQEKYDDLFLSIKEPDIERE